MSLLFVPKGKRLSTSCRKIPPMAGLWAGLFNANSFLAILASQSPTGGVSTRTISAL